MNLFNPQNKSLQILSPSYHPIFTNEETKAQPMRGWARYKCKSSDHRAAPPSTASREGAFELKLERQKCHKMEQKERVFSQVGKSVCREPRIAKSSDIEKWSETVE